MQRDTFVWRRVWSRRWASVGGGFKKNAPLRRGRARSLSRKQWKIWRRSDECQPNKREGPRWLCGSYSGIIAALIPVAVRSHVPNSSGCMDGSPDARFKTAVTKYRCNWQVDQERGITGPDWLEGGEDVVDELLWQNAPMCWVKCRF